MNRHILIVPVLVVAFGLLTWCAAVSSSGSSFAHKTSAIFFPLASIGLIFATIASTIVLWRKAKSYRSYSMLILVLTAVVLIGSTWYRVSQQSLVINKLESAYRSIVMDGAPFPTPEEIRHIYFSNLPNSYSTGCWVSPDQQTFEIYYHDSSDSYTMRYPDGEWDWRGCGYSGPSIAR